MSILEDIERAFVDVRASYRDLFGDAPTFRELRSRRALILGLNGPFRVCLLGRMGEVPLSRRPGLYARVLAFRDEVEGAYQDREAYLRGRERLH